jgi:S-adenosylmethionine synthetase
MFYLKQKINYPIKIVLKTSLYLHEFCSSYYKIGYNYNNNHLIFHKAYIGAGDQYIGIMFGYATNETSELFPLTHLLASKLAYQLSKVRKEKTLDWVRPDIKTQ